MPCQANHVSKPQGSHLQDGDNAILSPRDQAVRFTQNVAYAKNWKEKKKRELLVVLVILPVSASSCHSHSPSTKESIRRESIGHNSSEGRQGEALTGISVAPESRESALQCRT